MIYIRRLLEHHINICAENINLNVLVMHFTYVDYEWVTLVRRFIGGYVVIYIVVSNFTRSINFTGLKVVDSRPARNAGRVKKRLLQNL